MAKDLTNSTVDRQNILNNQYALCEIQLAVSLRSHILQGSRHNCQQGYKIATSATGVSEIDFLNTIICHCESLKIAKSFTPQWFHLGSQEQDSNICRQGRSNG